MCHDGGNSGKSRRSFDPLSDGSLRKILPVATWRKQVIGRICEELSKEEASLSHGTREARSVPPFRGWLRYPQITLRPMLFTTNCAGVPPRSSVIQMGS